MEISYGNIQITLSSKAILVIKEVLLSTTNELHQSNVPRIFLLVLDKSRPQDAQKILKNFQEPVKLFHNCVIWTLLTPDLIFY